MPRNCLYSLAALSYTDAFKMLNSCKSLLYISSQQKVHATKRTLIHLYNNGFNIKIVGPQRQSRWNDDDVMKDFENF